MIALLQRVTHGQVAVDGELIGQIGAGLLVLVCAEPADTDADGQALLDRLIRYRVFADEKGRMNRSLLDLQTTLATELPTAPVTEYLAQAGLLLVPQFTLAANTSSGLRPGFSAAAPPGLAAGLFEEFTRLARERIKGVQTGRFGADMQVSLTNDGPVTFWLQHPRAGA